MQQQQDEQISKENINYIIRQFQQKGFESLTKESLAITLIDKDFPRIFQQQTGIDWRQKFQIKALERLNYAQFDIQWLTRKSAQNDYFRPLFANIERNDIQKVKLFFNSIPKDVEYTKATDQTQKSPLHICSQKENSSEILEFLVFKGYNINARDRTLKTPLHYACIAGNVSNCRFLIQNGAQLDAKDSQGKNALHFASTGSQQEIVKEILQISPSLVHQGDNNGSLPLHYCVWNQSQAQVEIARNLIQLGRANVNARDDDGKTALHHASKAGKGRIIPILIESGCDITIKDKISKKTALEMACNDRIRELIVIYSTERFKKQHIGEDEDFLKIQQVKILEEKIMNEKVQVRINDTNNPICNIQEWIRSRFYFFMRKIQSEGIRSWYHLKKPYIYTASWFEGIKTMEELYQAMKDITPTEATVRVFNILCPYEQKIPPSTGNEEIIENFYGYQWTEKQQESFANEMAYQQSEQVNTELLEIQMNQYKELEEINEQLREQILQMEKQIQENTKAHNQLIEALKKQIQVKDDKIKQLQDNNTQQTKKIKLLEQQIQQQKQENIDLLNKKTKDDINYNNIINGLKQQIKKLEEQLEQSKQNIKEIEITEENIKNDDEAVLSIYQKLRNNPPGLIQRMINADMDQDGSLNSTEFMLFLETLRIPKVYEQILLKVAGFKQGRKAIQPNDFKNMLEERPLIKALWEKKLFSNIKKGCQKKNIALREAFEKMDCDNDGSINPQELKHGLEGLRIFVNQKDFLNFYTTIDKNSNNSVTLEEIEEVFQKKEIEAQNLQADVSFQDRFEKDEYEEKQVLLNENSESFNSTLKVQTLSQIKFTDDLQIINGDLKVQIPFIKDMLSENNQTFFKEIYARIVLRGSEKNEACKNAVLFDYNSINIYVKIPIRHVLKENLNDDLHIQLYSEQKFIEEYFLGEVKVIWKSALDKPLNWQINHLFKLENVSFVKQNTKKVQGQIAVQVKWIPSNSKEFTGGQIVEKDLFKPEKSSFVHTIVEKGILEFILVSSQLQQKIQKIKCQVTLPFSKAESYEAKYDAQGNPYWSQKCTKELQPMVLKQLDSVKVFIYYEQGTIFKEKYPVGEVYVDWQECLIYPGEYLTKKSYLFKQNPQIDKASKVYVQMRWIPESLYQKFLDYSSNNNDRKNDIINSKKDLNEGILKIMLVRAKDLQGNDSKDSSDPYVKFLFENYDKTITVVSKTKKYTINPVWAQLLQMNISYYKEGVVPPLKLQIWDADVISDDSLGTSIIDISPSINAPCTWAVDDYFDVDDPVLKDRENKPKIYVQTYFVPKGTNDPNIKPKDKDNLLEIRDENTIQGSLKIRVIHARELVGVNRNNTSDPFVQITFPGGSKEVKSNVISNSVNPQWNETFMEKILISKDKMRPIKFIVKNHDYLSSDDLLGIVDVDWQKCVDEPGQWAVNSVFELQSGGSIEIRNKAKQFGYIYVQIKFLEEYMIDDQTNPPLVENLAQMISEKQGLYKGTLRVFLVHCKNLVEADGKDDLNDSYVVFKVPGGKEIRSNTIQPMRVEVLDDDLVGKDLVGYCNVDLNGVLNGPGVWGINQTFKLDGNQSMRSKYKTENFGEIYMQIMFVTAGLSNEDKPLPLNEDLDEITRAKKEKDKQPVVGILEINVVLAQNLIAKDLISKSSDPYAEIVFPDSKKVSTKVIQKSLNPLWNQTFRYRINMLFEQYKPLKITIFNENTMAIDDELGSIELDWLECFENPTMWRINDMYELKGDQKMGQKFGKVYIQCKFLKDSDLDTPEGNYPCKTPENLIPEFGRVMGNLSVNIVSGANLKNTDIIGKSDPYVKAYIQSDPSSQIKTSVIKDDINPVWNFSGKFYLNLLRCQVKEGYVIFDVFDEDNVSDEQIGQCKLHIVDFLENPKKDVQQDMVISEINKPGTNYGTLRVILNFEPTPHCEDLTGLRVPEQILKGDLAVKIVNGRQFKKADMIGSCDPFALFNLDLYPDKKYKTNIKNKDQNPDFNFEQLIPLEIPSKKCRLLSLQVKFYDNDFIGKTVLGGITISLKDIFEQGSTVSYISKYFQLFDEAGSLTQQYSFIQILWRPEGQTTTDYPQIEDFQEFKKKTEPPRIPSELIINVVGARKLKTSWTDIPDPFTEIKLSHGSKTVLTTKTIDNNPNPLWNFEGKIPLNLNEQEQENLKAYVTVIDYDYVKNDKLGSVEIPLKELFGKGNWFNQILPLLDENSFPGGGEVYVQIYWAKEGENVSQKPNDLFQEEKKTQEQKQKEEKEKQDLKNSEPFIKGELFINIIEGRNLLNLDPFDLSDPFVEVTFNFVKQNIKSPTIDNNLNPQWNFEKVLPIEIRQSEMEKTSVLFTLYDYDYNANDFLGYAEVNIDTLFKNPGSWSNEIHQLCDEKGNRGKNGLFYAQVQWRPEGKKIDLNPPQKIDISQFYKGVTPKGTVVICALLAKNILGVEQKGKYSDAQLIVQFNKQTQKTAKIQSLNPEWKQIFQFKVNFKDRSEMPFLYCSLVDWNFVGDTFLGDFEGDISQILENPNQWAIQKDYALVNLKKQKIVDDPTGIVHLKIGFVEEGKDIFNEKAVRLGPHYDEIYQSFLTSCHSSTRNNLVIYGIEGMGRKFSIKYAIQRLQEKEKIRLIPIHIKADIFKTENDFVEELMSQISSKFQNDLNKFESNDCQEMIFNFSNIQEYLEAEDGQWVLIVDKIDKLALQQRQSILYSLLDWLQNNRNKLTLVGITSDINFLDKLEKRVRSRFCADAFNCFFYEISSIVKIMQNKLSQIMKQSPENQIAQGLHDVLEDQRIVDYFEQNFFMQMKPVKYIIKYLKTVFCLIDEEQFITNYEIEELPSYILELFEEAQKLHQDNREMTYAKDCTKPELYVLICIKKMVINNRHPITTQTIIQEIKNFRQKYYSQNQKGSSLNFSNTVLEQAIENLVNLEVLKYYDNQQDQNSLILMNINLNEFQLYLTENMGNFADEIKKFEKSQV